MTALLFVLMLQGTYLSPEDEQKAFVVADGFEVNLFAAEPMVANPVQMIFDARGRLWVANAQAFPQIEAGQIPSDTVVVLEDTNGDGRADKHTVFADNLLVPTGLELGHGGLYVASQPDLLFLKDTDGDGKADRRRVLFSGFGTEDNHHAINSFVWGPNGRLYFHSGIFLHSAIETPRGPLRIDAVPTVFELHPASLDLRTHVRSREFVNMWGHAFDRWGRNLLSDASSGNLFLMAPGMNEHVAPMGYPKIPTPRVSCGIEFTSGAHLPEAHRGLLLLNNVTRKQVSFYRVDDDGSGVAVKELQPPLIQSKEDCFRPVDVAMGPDGAIYVLDFYNLIVGQMTYNFRDPRRNHTRGRIWRITAKGRPLLAPPRIEGATVREQLDLLKSPYDPARYQARRAVRERGREAVMAPLAAWLKDLDPADPDFDHHRLEALWMYEAIDLANPALMQSLLIAADPRARRAATRILGASQNPFYVRETLLKQVRDPSPAVRLEAVTALGRIGGFREALRALDLPMDRHLDFALKVAVDANRRHWLPLVEAGELPFDGKDLIFALQSVEAAGVIPRVLQFLRSNEGMPSQRRSFLQLVAERGGADDLAELLKLPDPPFAAIARAARERKVRPSGDLTKIRDRFDNPEAVRLAGAWKLEPLRLEIARRSDRAAYDALAEMGGDESLAILRRRADGDPAAIGALAALDPKDAAGRTAAFWVAGPASPGELFDPFLRRKNGPETLAAALKARGVPADHAKMGLRALYAAGRDDAALIDVLKAAAALKSMSRELPPDEMKEWVKKAREQGDPARGEAVFRRAEMSCLKCHSVGGAGGQVGPDLATVGSSFPADYLIDSILVPNKMIKEGYAAHLILTKGGDVINGIKVRETSDRLVLRDPARGDVEIPVASIDRRKEIGSLMPSGLPDLLTEPELVDLVRFLSELGRPGPYAVANLPVLRRWRSNGMPLYSEASGVLPLAGITKVTGEIEVTTPGRMRLRLNSAKGLSIRVDGEGVAGADALDLDLQRGIRSLEFTVDGAARGGLGLRAELEEMAGSNARAVVVGGP